MKRIAREEDERQMVPEMTLAYVRDEAWPRIVVFWAAFVSAGFVAVYLAAETVKKGAVVHRKVLPSLFLSIADHFLHLDPSP
jgi:hypothetical protein